MRSKTNPVNPRIPGKSEKQEGISRITNGHQTSLSEQSRLPFPARIGSGGWNGATCKRGQGTLVWRDGKLLGVEA